MHESSQKNFYGACNDFVLDRTNAKMKIGWIHGDFSLCGANNKYSHKLYPRFDKVVACSEGTRDVFLKCIPACKEKCFTIRNCNDYEMIKLKSQPAIDYNEKKFNIITVARLSEEKGLERALYAIKYCENKGYDLKYHIIGSGSEEKRLKELAFEIGLNETVYFYGNQINPYPYMVNADLFMLTSYHEAAPMVFDEAMSLGVPLLSTKTTSTDEMILNIGGGYVCENNQKAINEKLEYILAHQAELIRINQQLKDRNFNNLESIQKFIDLIR